MRYWVLQPLVVRKGLAAPAAAGTGSGSGSANGSSRSSASGSSGGGSSQCASPAPLSSPTGAGFPEELVSPRTGAPLTDGVVPQTASSPVARVAQTLRRLIGNREADLEVLLSPSSCDKESVA